MEAWIGIIGTLLGVAFGGVLTHWTSNTQSKRQRRWEVNRLIQTKLEDIAELLDDLESRYRKISGDAILKVHSGKPMVYEGRLPTARLNALISFYAPELVEEKKQLERLAHTFGEVLVKTIDVKSDEPQKKALIAELLRGHHQIEDACESMASKAAMIARDRLAVEKSNITFGWAVSKARAAQKLNVKRSNHSDPAS